MTDKQINDLFDTEKRNPQNIVSVEYQKLISNRDAVDKAAMIGFYAGFKTAERLAKIEVLEHLAESILIDGLDFNCIMYRISNMIKELKEGE